MGAWWELPGGGIEPGETHLDAGIRELREETGIVVKPEQVGMPLWRRRATFRHRQTRILQDEIVVTVRLLGEGPAVDASGQLDYEVEDYFDWRWWPLSTVIEGVERFYPGDLATLLPRVLTGEEVDEPFERWS